MADTGTFRGPQSIPFTSRKDYEVLAAKNAALRLRAASGHVFSFTDLTSADGALNFGHLNPSIDPFSRITADLAPSIFPPSAASYAAWLCGKLGLDAHAVHYVTGERSAVCAAIELAQRIRAGKVAVIAGSDHERVVGGVRHGLKIVSGDAARIARGGKEDRRSQQTIRISVGSEFSAWGDVSCLIYEPIQGASGYVPLALPWLRGLSQSAQAAGVTVIADETQCGFFRFGRLSLAASEFLRPDFYLFGNSMTNGIFPLFALIYPDSLRDRVLTEEEGWRHTFQTACLGYGAAEAVAAYIDGNDIEGMVARIHAILGQTGEALAANPCLSDFHLAGPTLSLEVSDERAGELALGCEESGVLIGLGGKRRVCIAPPVTIFPEQLVTALKAVKKAAAAL